MTAARPLAAKWATSADGRSLCVVPHGDLDYHTGDELVSNLTTRLEPGLRDVPLNCAGLTPAPRTTARRCWTACST